ncbi:MAG: sensor histidine kinase [Candidatus Dormibacteraeota bacterium]|nr:sensor histidine kinase [Candidatus Dormibacteraeota bacterium]
MAERSVESSGSAFVRAGAFGLLALYVALGIVAIALNLLTGGLRLKTFAPLIFGAYPVMGVLILVRRGNHAVGWILAVAGTLVLLLSAIDDYAALSLGPRQALPAGAAALAFQPIVWASGLFLFTVALPLIFPTGNLLSRRWLVVFGLGLTFLLLELPSNMLIAGHTFANYPEIVNPIGLAGQEDLLQAIGPVGIVPGILALIGVVASLVVRFRRSRGIERQQIKVFLLTFLLLPAGMAVQGIPGLGEIAYAVAVGGIPIAIGLAVIRYRLYDIEVVISRTLVYGALAAFITAVYVGIVVGVGTLVGSGGQPNLLLSIVATAIVAVAFQPVRESLQKIANRLVYGKRATPYEVLSQFSERVAETYAAEEALPRMARVLAEGTGAERAKVWLRAGTLLRPAASWPESGDGADEPVPARGDDLPDLPGEQAVPVRHQGELLGVLTVTKRAGESLTPIEQKLLDDLAHQAGLVLKNVGLTAELLARLEDLRASRQRLVAAQDEERRRLERNLHDGAQQNLVAIKVKLGLAETLADKDPAKARELIGQLKGDTDEALETLRDLARGIYPPLLADRGLAAALEAQARKATLPVDIDSDGVGRYSQDLEAAVYFCVLEALQNVQKYAGATRASVRLQVEQGSLTFEVDDDGRGFDPSTREKGSGTQNMEDRLDALGGQLEVRSTPGHGATVAGRLPIMELVTAI